ncbi:hypothetical protein PR048_026469 [Dryococelus australis]|uniref:Uncharacterized protein n=1 Tax=Dryococelus australis TaxID=614101 RepID=A0ABQ9GLF0_9NEOP|nr:hypothetical protein PR048_026469 [Dryococelus australis]
MQHNTHFDPISRSFLIAPKPQMVEELIEGARKVERNHSEQALLDERTCAVTVMASPFPPPWQQEDDHSPPPHVTSLPLRQDHRDRHFKKNYPALPNRRKEAADTLMSTTPQYSDQVKEPASLNNTPIRLLTLCHEQSTLDEPQLCT